MRERQAKVLRGLIHEYVRTGQPVSSKQLVDKCGLRLSSASIRSVLQDLCDAGFVYQLHTSAGRIPTDSGYRYYLDNMTVTSLPDAVREKLHKQWEDLSVECGSKQLAMAKILCRITKALAVVARGHDTQFAQSGFADVFKGESSEQIDLIQDISVLLDNMHHLLQEVRASEGQLTTVYVGRENPYFSCYHLSLMLHCSGADQEEKDQIIMLIGPKRMRYRHNLALLQEVDRIFND